MKFAYFNIMGGGALTVAVLFSASSAHADVEPAPPAVAVGPAAAPATVPTPIDAEKPSVGGHLGFAVPIVSIGKNTALIGRDFSTLGLTPGITVKLSDKWSVDFEFVALNDINHGRGGGLVVDPGVIYNAGPVAVGVRVATQIGAPSNIGLVPILVLPLPVKLCGKLTPYIEGDVPLFLTSDGNELQPTIGFQFQAGVAF